MGGELKWLHNDPETGARFERTADEQNQILAKQLRRKKDFEQNGTIRKPGQGMVEFTSEEFAPKFTRPVISTRAVPREPGTKRPRAHHEPLVPLHRRAHNAKLP